MSHEERARPRAPADCASLSTGTLAEWLILYGPKGDSTSAADLERELAEASLYYKGFAKFRFAPLALLRGRKALHTGPFIPKGATLRPAPEGGRAPQTEEALP